MKKDKKGKLIVLISGITVILLMIVGISFAIFRFGRESSNQQLVLGDIWMNYAESNGIFLEGALPGDPYSNYFEFTISGTNTYTKKDIYYDISLVRGEVPQEKEEANRIEDKYLKFRLTEVVGDTETEIFTDKTYSSLENKRIHVETIGKGISNYSKTYRLYMVLSSELRFGNSEGAVLTMKEFEQAFASVKVNVTGDFEEKEVPSPSAVETIIENVVTYEIASASGFTGGLVAINGTEGDDYGLLYNENNDTHTIREYRYSGLDVDNYIYYNCPDAAGGKNYGDLDYDYASNCETWRIVGIFYENGEQFLKIMNNNTLTDIPTTYVIDDTTYTVGENGTTAYWNKPDTLKSTNYNDWTTSGLQYYLNTEQDESETPVAGYLSTLSTNAKNLIRETTYYLGNVDLDVSTVKLSYEQERDETRKWEDNEPIWPGKVGLLYPSDYGYSASNIYWETDMNGWNAVESDGVIASSTSWMMQTANHNTSIEWFLSPSSNYTFGALVWSHNWNVGWSDMSYFNESAREVLYLKSNTKVLKGDGDVNSPYVVVEG